MKPSSRYTEILEQPEFNSDDQQWLAIQLLDDLYLRLEQIQRFDNCSWWQRLLRSRESKAAIRGIYFWGGVGRGKTFLMDVFYQSLPDGNKMRTHFHEFMNRIHGALKQKASLENPLRNIAQELAGQVKVLCLDEFVITEIGDAMIMAGLLEPLFEAGVVLVTTSNSAPAKLYHDGLQRARFLPSIELISRHCDVFNLDGGEDYRLKGLQQTDLYTVPHSPAALEEIHRYLDEHVTSIQECRKSLLINGRELDFQLCAESTIWFTFEELCKTTRSQKDYLEIARLFNTLILTDIEKMTPVQDDIARRFVLLIDVIYDHRVKLICTAESYPDDLYQGRRLAFEFERTRSRLIEMQSQAYLTKAHTQQ